VRQQTHPNVEHVIISDGSDPSLWPMLQDKGASGIRFAELGRNWRQFSHGASYGAIPRLVGTCLARGDYIGYLDDDDEFLPEHCAKLLTLLQQTGAAFAFSQFKRFWSDCRPPDVIGSDISYGHIGTPIILHKAECLLTRNWACDGYGEDFCLLDAWKKAGLRFAHLPEITVHVHKTV
jgi:glycosyltransferase involved in cell wall biosynthesis